SRIPGAANRAIRGCSSPTSHCVSGDPQQNGEGNTANERAPGQRFTLIRLEAVAEVPDEVPDAAEQMMQQRTGIAEYDQPPDEAAGKGLHVGIGGGPRGGCDQPPRQQQGAEI